MPANKRRKKMKNKLEDLNNHLFDMIERIMDEDLKDEEEIKKVAVKSQILCNLTIQVLNAGKLAAVGYELADGSFGKKRPPNFFLEEGYNDSATEITEGDQHPTPLLQFRGKRVSQEDCKGKKLLGNQHAL
jgi:hypothetical protein